MNKKKRTLLRTTVIGFTAIATSLTIGVSAACSKGDSSDNNEEDKTTTKIDEQTIKNGNFEFYSDNKGLYPISSPDSWSSGSNGTTSSSMSGIIDTGKERWDYITDPDLPQTLEDNDDLESDDDDKKDYNGALTDDLPYKNTHTAIDSDADEEDKAYIDNPFTHKYGYNSEGKVIDVEGNEIETFTDEDGEVFLDSEFKQPLETSVLMLHNYHRGDYHGTESYYNSATTVSLEANTAAEISLWVKTTELYFGGASTERTKVEFGHGAYIKVNTQVGGNSLDSIVIKNIDTEKINPKPESGVWENNGWVKYTVFVEASSFATTTVNLTLGLGEYENSTVEGYAFFDDVSLKKYLNKTDMETKNAEFGENIRETATNERPNVNVSYPLAPEATTVFRTDVEKYKTEDGNGSVKDDVSENNFADRHFFIDFASSTTDNTFNLNTNNVKAGLTVEATNTGKYVCTEYNSAGNAYKTNGLEGIGNPSDKLYIPNALRNNAININDDVLATTTVTNADDWAFNAINTEYSEILTDALKSATGLPGAGASTDALVLLSARGAAYEAHITDSSFTLNDGEYMLVSFWLKTSDMKGNTAATVTVKGLGEDKDNSASFTVDSTAQGTVSIGEGEDKVEDVYDGWVRCFVRVSNTSKTSGAKNFELVLNFGNTAIRNTSRSAFKYGWVAMTNPSVMKLDKDVYAYTAGSSQTATLTFSETEEKVAHRFDTEQGEKNEIKTDLANPSSYTGVNGASKFIKPDGEGKLESYDDTNKNAFAGLLSKDNFANYQRLNAENSNNCMWYNALNTIAGAYNTSDELWNAVFGEYTVQPLLIVNTARSFKNKTSNTEESKIYNYGFIGNSASVSANGYTPVSVRVKASAGAVANVYLVEDKSAGGVLSYVTPKYNFWYDDDGNILKGKPDEDATAAEQKKNIAYNLRKDGLYENGDGKLYANFYNLTKYYDISFEHADFYDENGNLVLFNNLDGDKVYYADQSKTAYAPHYLIAGGKANNKVYKYCGGLGAEATYYYVEDGKANTSKVVYGVDTTVAALRYNNTEASSAPYSFTIDTVANPEYADKWITVTFYIHAGAETKNYKLELWSGSREADSSYTEVGYAKDSYVIFDYSNLGESLDQTTFDGLVNGYVTDIIEEYKKIIPEFEDNDGNINDLEKLAGEENRVNKYNYEASYYTFSLFDSEAFIPFNGEINKDGTGYSFNYSESAESLAYLKVIDSGVPEGGDLNDAIYTMSSFIDYSIIDKDIDIIGEPTAPDDSNSDSSVSSESSVNVLLLASSIILVVAIFGAIAAIFIRDFVKKHKRTKTAGKNSYNFNRNKRYVKKYVKANGEAPEIAESDFDESLLSDKTPADDAAEEADTEKVETDNGTVEDTVENADQPAENEDGGDAAEQNAEGENPEDGKE